MQRDRLHMTAFLVAMNQQFRTLHSLLQQHHMEDALEQARQQYPDSPIIARLAGSQDMKAFLKRLVKVDWNSGNPDRGRETFTRLGCAVCHSGTNRLGPTMRKVSARFGREDFFRHTFLPNLAISDLYRASEIQTRDGRTFIGLPVYESPEQTLLELSNGQGLILDW